MNRSVPRFSYKDDPELKQIDETHALALKGVGKDALRAPDTDNDGNSGFSQSKIVSEEFVKRALSESVTVVVPTLESLLEQQDLEDYALKQQIPTSLPKIPTPKSRSPSNNAVIVELFNKTHQTLQPLKSRKEELDERRSREYLGKRMEALSNDTPKEGQARSISRPATPNKLTEAAGDRTPGRSIASSGRATPNPLSRGSSKGRSPSALAGAGLIDEAAKKAALRRQTILSMHKLKTDSRGASAASNDTSGVNSRASSGAATPSMKHLITPRGESIHDEPIHPGQYPETPLYEDETLDQGDLILAPRVRIQPVQAPRPSAIYVPANQSTAAMTQAIISQGVAPMGPLGQFTVQMKLRESGAALQDVYCPVPMGPNILPGQKTPMREVTGPRRETVSDSSSVNGDDENQFGRAGEILIPERSFEAGSYLQGLSAGSYSANSLHLVRPSLNPLLAAILSYPGFKNSAQISASIPKWANGITQLLLMDLPSAYIILNESFVSSGEYSDHWKVMQIRNAIKRLAIRIGGLDRDRTTPLNKFKVLIKSKDQNLLNLAHEIKRRAAEYSQSLVPEYLDSDSLSHRASTSSALAQPSQMLPETQAEKKGLATFDLELPRGTSLEDGHLVLVYENQAQPRKESELKESRPVNWIADDQKRFCVLGVITSDVYGKIQLNISEKFSKLVENLARSRTFTKLKIIGNISYRMRQFLNLQKLDLEPLSQFIYKPSNLDNLSLLSMRKCLNMPVATSIEFLSTLCKLDSDQIKALHQTLMLRHGIQLITGAPGTGKSRLSAVLLLLFAIQQKTETKVQAPVMVVASTFLHLIAIFSELKTIQTMILASTEVEEKPVIKNIKAFVKQMQVAALVNNLPTEFWDYSLVSKPQKKSGIGLLAQHDLVFVLPNSHKVSVFYEADHLKQSSGMEAQLPVQPEQSDAITNSENQNMSSSIFLPQKRPIEPTTSLVFEVPVTDLLQEIGVINTCLVEDAHRLREDAVVGELIGRRIERLVLVGDEKGLPFGTGGVFADPTASFCTLSEDDIGGQHSARGLAVFESTMRKPNHSEPGLTFSQPTDRFVLEEEEITSQYNRSLLERIMKSRGFLNEKNTSATSEKPGFIRLTYQHRVPAEVAAFVKKEFFNSILSDITLESERGWAGQSHSRKFKGYNRSIFRNHTYFFDFETTHKSFGSLKESSMYYGDGAESTFEEMSGLGSPEGSRAPSTSDMGSVRASAAGPSSSVKKRVVRSKPSVTYNNIEEASLVVSLVELLKLKLGDEQAGVDFHLKSQIGVVAGFEGQKLMLEKLLVDRNISGVKVGLPVEFECNQIQVLIISMTKTSEVEVDPVASGLKDPQVLCNLLSRVSHGLYIVGKQQAWKNCPIWWNLIQHYDERVRCKKVLSVELLERELHEHMTRSMILPCRRLYTSSSSTTSKASQRRIPTCKAEPQTHALSNNTNPKADFSQAVLREMMQNSQRKIPTPIPPPVVSRPPPSGTVREMLLQLQHKHTREQKQRDGIFGLLGFD